MIIRDATPDDLPAIVEIYNASIPGRLATADTEPVSVASRTAWFRDHTPGTHPLWIASEPGGPVRGWLSFQSFYGRPAYRATAELSVYVATDEQRRGIGRELLNAALDRAPTLGLTALLGFIFAHNAPSLALFERAGFERWGHLPQVAELDGIPRDLIIVGKRLVTT